MRQREKLLSSNKGRPTEKEKCWQEIAVSFMNACGLTWPTILPSSIITSGIMIGQKQSEMSIDYFTVGFYGSEIAQFD